MRGLAFDAAALLNDYRIAPFQWRHLRKFYISLLCVSASSALGSYCTEYIGSFVALSVALACLYCFYCIPFWHKNKRAFLLSLGAFFGWAFLNPWLTWYLGVDTGFTVTLLSATCVGFGCYLVASIWTRRYDMVYLYAMCLCIPLVLLCLLICSYVFGGDSARWEYQVYALLLLFMTYVAAYSQFVMQRARRGESDYVTHAYSLFIEFPLVFIHCMKMMIARWYR